MRDFLLVLLGVVAGALSGLIGIGGGVIVVPALIFLFGFGQHEAQGTTLALLVPPIGLAAAWVYYREGFVDLEAAILVCSGFVVGALFGARIATALSSVSLERVFGAALLAIGFKMLLS
jgi:uncharacterized membrane protein YfcA